MLAVRHPEGFAFVSADHRGLPRPTDRRLIRSHCMRGKNKRQQAKASSKPLELDPRRGTHRVPDVSKTPNAAIEEQHPTTLLSWNASMVDTITEQQRIKAVLSHSVVPLPSPHDLSLIRLVVELDTRSQALLFKFFSVGRSFAYPVDFCVDFEVNKTVWFEWLDHDLAYLHSCLLGAAVLQNFIAANSPSKTMYHHLRSTISLLNQQLCSPHAPMWDSTVAVIVTLTTLAGATGDHVAEKAHIAGLQQMVNLRGGLEGFTNNAKLHIKIRRLDLSLCLDTGEPAHFSTNPSSWSSIFPDKPTESQSHYPAIQSRHLLTTFHDLQHFTHLLNIASQPDFPRIRDTDFQRITSSIQYRLLHLQDRLATALDECYRLAMLAYLKTTYQIPGWSKSGQYGWFKERFMEFLDEVPRDTWEEEQGRVDGLLWLVMIAAVAVFGAREEWVRECWRRLALQGLEWVEVRKRLQGVMWIDMIQDKGGKEVFDSLKEA